MDDAQIRAEIEIRKQRAKDLGLPQAVFRLYEDHLKYLRDNFDHGKSGIPDSLTKVVRIKTNNHDWSEKSDSVELFFGEKCIIFVFKEHTSTFTDYYTYGNLLIIVEGQEVFDLACHCRFVEEVGNEWSPGDVKGFIEGPWVADVQKFAEQVCSMAERRKGVVEQERKRQELERAKKKFGL